MGKLKFLVTLLMKNFKLSSALEIITAIGRGFSPQKAVRLLKCENTLHVINLREFGAKSPEQMESDQRKDNR